ncbi:MAG: oligosaccharide flippase family protein [Pirellulaceae bacterium]|nr:oligosaccharide flippase family protein [Pirellulaceae bacterium]
MGETRNCSDATIKRRALWGVVFNWAAHFSGILVAFFLTPFVVRSLGDESYGVWSIIMSFVSYYALADLGLKGAGERQLAKHLGAGELIQAARVVVSSWVAYVTLAVLLLVLVLGLAWVFPRLFQVDPPNVWLIRGVVFVTGLTVAVRLPGQVFAASLAAVQRFDLLNIVGIVSQLANAAGYVLVLRWGYGLLGLATVTLVVAVVSQLALAGLARQAHQGLPLAWSLADWHTLRELLRFGGANFYANVARQVSRYAGGIVIGLVAGPSVVTFYAISESVARSGVDLGKALTTIVGPLASRLDGQNRRESLRRLMILGSRLLTACALTLLVLSLFLGHRFLALWISPHHADHSYPILVLLSLSLVATMPGNSLRVILYGIGNLRIFMVSASLELLLMLVLGPLLVVQVGAAGMAWAVLIASFVTGWLVLPRYTCHALEVPLWTYFQETVARPALAVAPAAATAWLLSAQFPASRMGWLLAQVAGVLAISGGCGLLVCLEPSLRRELLRLAVPARWRPATDAAS